jgi:hypothetical protein
MESIGICATRTNFYGFEELDQITNQLCSVDNSEPNEIWREHQQAKKEQKILSTLVQNGEEDICNGNYNGMKEGNTSNEPAKTNNLDDIHTNGLVRNLHLRKWEAHYAMNSSLEDSFGFSPEDDSQERIEERMEEVLEIGSLNHSKEEILDQVFDKIMDKTGWYFFLTDNSR